MAKKHDEEELVSSKNGSVNQNILYGIIILLLIIIAVWGFFLGMKLGQESSNWWYLNSADNGWNSQELAASDDITVTIYDDKRCSDCETQTIVEQLKQVPILTNAEFIIKEFSDDGISSFLQENSIKLLPAAVFSTNVLWPDLAPYLTPLKSWEYSLALWATHDPFLERSPNWFLVADNSILQEIKSTAYYDGPAEAKITWVEYTDVNCGFCKKMETDGTAKTVLAEFPNELNKTTSNFIGVGWAATQKAAEILECAGKIGGATAYNSILSKILVEGKNDEASMLTIAAEQWLNQDTLKSCIDNEETKDIVAQKFSTGSEKFGITGTPGNVLINNETGEYKIISGAYPADTFIATVNELLGK